MARPVVVVVQYQARPGMAAIARTELAKLIADVQAKERVCLGISLHQNADQPERLFLYERWADREIFSGPHMKTPHLQAFIAGAMQSLAGPPEISFWEAAD